MHRITATRFVSIETMARPALLLFLVNLFLCRNLFFLPYLKYMHTNEGAFLALTRLLRDFPTEILWWPFWNAGIPYTHAYFPLLPAASALVAAFGLDTPAAFHTVCAVFYCLGPVVLFLMASELSGRCWPAFAAALGYSLFSPCALLIPAVREDLGGLWNLRRLQTLVFYSEGPHVAALALLPLAVLFYYRAMRGGRLAAVAALICTAGIVLTNAFGIASLAVAVTCLVLAEAEKKWRRAWIAVVIGVLGVLWVSPWIPPSLLESIRVNSQTAGGDFRPTAASILTAILLPAFVLLLRFAVLPRFRLPTHLNFAILFACLMAAVPLLAFHTGVDVVPQGKRYTLELDMAVWLLVAFATGHLTRRLPRRAKAVVVVVLILGASAQFLRAGRFAEGLIRPHPGVERTVEFRVAKWFEEHLPGRRVMASGSCSLWLNAFTDVPQLSGGNDATALNWMQRVAVFIVYTGEGAGSRDGEIAVMWLKAFGAHAITVHGPRSEEAYKPVRNPAKFEGLLPVLWRDRDDVIYSVPQRSASLARVIPATAVVRRAPAHGLDVGPMMSYVAALDDTSLPPAEFRWRNHHSAIIRARVARDQVISVQTNYHPGWRASVNGVPVKVDADGLGLLVLRSVCDGECEVNLRFDGGGEAVVTRTLSGLVTLAVLVWLFRMLPRRRNMV